MFLAASPCIFVLTTSNGYVYANVWILVECVLRVKLNYLTCTMQLTTAPESDPDNAVTIPCLNVFLADFSSILNGEFVIFSQNIKMYLFNKNYYIYTSFILIML